MKDDFLRALFTRVAGRYDLLNRALTFGVDVSWRRRAISWINSEFRIPNSELKQDSEFRISNSDFSPKILDLATGTADMAVALARRFPGARITGLDLTPAMLEIGRKKVEAAGLAGGVELVEGNAQALPFADGTFDVVTCAFGFRNFPDKQKALDEAARVLKPGGELLVLELFRMESRFLAKLTSCWLRVAAPLLASGTKSDYAYLRASIEGTVSANEFAAMAGKSGMELIRHSFFLPSCHCALFVRLRSGAVTP